MRMTEVCPNCGAVDWRLLLDTAALRASECERCGDLLAILDGPPLPGNPVVPSTARDPATLPPLLASTLAALGSDDAAAVIEALAREYGWAPVADEMFQLLEDNRQPAHWYTATVVLWFAVLDQVPLPADRVIALLYHRVDGTEHQWDNLVWSITSRLKGEEYLSDYNPLKDPGVLRELARLQAP